MEKVIYYDRKIGAAVTLDMKDKQWFTDLLTNIEKGINAKTTIFNQMQVVLHLSRKVVYINAIWIQ